MVLAFLKGVIVDVVSEMSERVANVQMTQIINNNKTVIYLCEQCAREEGKFNVISPFSINDFFSGFMGFPYMASAPQQNQDVVCETCGMSYEELKSRQAGMLQLLQNIWRQIGSAA